MALWFLNTAIAPNGKTIAFTFKRDIYLVAVTGGKATRITTHAYYDNTKPV
ncbi:MAG: hypothetical protein HRT67_07365 [Flavobacteriaceae bacterium]|nr:hypothetical protein [Flavobacteriaceae bacterium]